MKKIITLAGIAILLPACTLDLAGDSSSSSSLNFEGSGISVDSGFGIGDDSGFIGTIGDGNFEFGDGKLF